MRIIKRKGFSLVELLVVVAILGILTTLAVAAYSRYIDKAKAQKEKQNEETIIAAAKAYLNSNTDERPKTIGESTKITLRTLKKTNYLKEDIKNRKDESCMEKSYVYVYKNDYTKYSYKGILYCGNDKVNPDEEIPKPVVSNFTFSDMNEINNASFSMILKGNSDESVGIESYNYTISLINNDNEEKKEVYSSGAINGRENKKIYLNKIMIRDYIKITDYNSVKVTVIVRNNLGGVTEYVKTSPFYDNKGPKCSLIEGEANQDDWINKEDILNNQKRQISVYCNDEYGSGCIRNKFSKTWPDNNKESIEYSTIRITDNNKNNTDCSVRVNIDNKAPTINIKLINYSTLTETVHDGEKKTIESTDFPSNKNGWLNKDKYPSGVEFEVNTSDDISISKYKWETNGSEAKEEILNNNSNSQLESSKFKISLIDEGIRSGILTVYDKAGNSTSITINANIDRTAPTNPTVSGYKKKTSQNISSSAGLETYTFNSWYKGYVYTEANNSIDNLSGIDGYYCTTKGQKEDITNKKQSSRNVNIEGKVSIKYKACDKAGNCTNNIENMVLLDRSAPVIECNITKSKGIAITKKTDNNLSGVNNSSLRYVASMASSKEGIQAAWETTNDKIIEKLNSSTTCGGSSLKGYVSVADVLGNTDIYKCSKEVEQPTCCSEANPFGCSIYSACRVNITTTIFEKSTTATETGYVYHDDDGYTKLYHLGKEENGKTYVCAEIGGKYGGYFYTGASWIDWSDKKVTVNGKSCYKVWIYTNCVGEGNSSCSSKQCRG